MKLDVKTSWDCYRAGHGEFRTLVVPPMRYVMLDGHGDPNTAPEYAAAIATLYPLAYAVKFASRRELDRDFVVPPLEALWWAADMDAFTTRRDKSQWDWTVMLLVPEWISETMYGKAVASVAAKRPPALDRVRLETLDEGLCVQTLHLGPYDDEADVLATMHRDVIPAAGLRRSGKHHEIYLNDPRRTARAKLRTILRQPVTGVQDVGALT